VLEKLADKRPHELARLIAYTMPKEFLIKEQTVNGLSDEQVSAMLDYLNEQMGNSAKMIDAELAETVSTHTSSVTVAELWAKVGDGVRGKAAYRGGA
jgi:mono/diheme cytochrome c family protein